MQVPAEVTVEEGTEIVERVAAIDVAKATGMVCTRAPHERLAGKRVTKVWEVKATTRGISELADHLVAEGVTRVVMESTSDYWRPFYYLLEAAGLVCWVVNARQVKNVPGRPKTDKIDAIWLAKLAERSMVSPSFVPPEAGRHVRDLARARFDLVEDRTRVKQRVEKLLEDALTKVSSVLTDIHGVSGRAMIEALIAGERDPKVLAELAKGRARARLGDLAEAVDGRFTDHHARLARMLLDQIDDLTRRVEAVTGMLDTSIAALGQQVAPAVDAATGEITSPSLDYTSAVERISAMPGGGADTARAVIAEIGLDMTVFGTAGRLCSWAKVSPRTVQSGRKTGKAVTGKGNPYLKAALGQMATGAAKTDTFLGARYYRRLAKRMPKSKALAAIERSILVVIFQLLADPTTTFRDLGADFYDKRMDTARRTRNLVAQLEALGHHVALTPAA
ncbi:MAG: IS110 family transposase [Actinomycetota bacterium]|jgi:transposase|nr:IS110 family transposase [Actinomycetota bacterium]